MGLGFRLNLKWGLSLQPSLSSTSSSLPSSTQASFKSKIVNYDMARVSLPMEGDSSYTDHISGNTCSSTSRILDIDYMETDNFKRSVRSLLQDDKLTFLTSLQAKKISQYRLLLENLVVLEDTFADSDVVTLERDILVQLEKIGASKFLHTSFSENPKYPFSNNPINEETIKPIVPSTRKVERKLKRERMSKKVDEVCTVEFHSQTVNHKNSRRVNVSSRRLSNSKSGRIKITRNEAELSRGVKMVANLERIRMMLEEETGPTVSFTSWAAAAGVDKKELLENLQFGWRCRDELLRSTRSLVIYLAKNYNGQGIAFKDLIQCRFVLVAKAKSASNRIA